MILTIKNKYSKTQIIKLIKNGKFNNASHIGMFLFYKKKYAR